MIETAKLLINKYPWHYMTVSAQKILHRSSVNGALFFIGQLSDEAHNTRLDVFLKIILENLGLKQMLICFVSYDPLISSLRKLHVKKCHSQKE